MSTVPTWVAVLPAAATVVGAVGAFWSVRITQNRSERLAKWRELLAIRTEAYAEAWSVLMLLRENPTDAKASSAERTLSDAAAFTRWYEGLSWWKRRTRTARLELDQWQMKADALTEDAERNRALADRLDLTASDLYAKLQFFGAEEVMSAVMEVVRNIRSDDKHFNDAMRKFVGAVRRDLQI